MGKARNWDEELERVVKKERKTARKWGEERRRTVRELGEKRVTAIEGGG